MTVMGQTYTERKAAGEAVIKACMLMDDPEKIVDLGEFRGFPMQLRCDGSKFRVTMKQNLTYSAELSDDAVGNVTRINNALESLAERLDAQKARLAINPLSVRHSVTMNRPRRYSLAWSAPPRERRRCTASVCPPAARTAPGWRWQKALLTRSPSPRW